MEISDTAWDQNMVLSPWPLLIVYSFSLLCYLKLQTHNACPRIQTEFWTQLPF